MDVRCSTCDEPWDVYHLRHEEIFDTDLCEAEATAWLRLPLEEQLAPRYREKFRAVGWEFGQSVLNVIRCPCCPPGAKPDADHLAIKAALEDVLGDDEDALAAAFEDHHL